MQEDMIWPTDTVPKLLCEPPLFAGSRDESLIAAQPTPRAAQEMALLEAKFGVSNLFYTTKTVSGSQNPPREVLIRPLALVFGVTSKPGDSVVAPRQLTPKPFQSYTCAGARRLPITSAVVTP
jgi:hypothetical protein